MDDLRYISAWIHSNRVTLFFTCRFPYWGIFNTVGTGYPVGMNTLPILMPRTLTVVCVPSAACEPLAQLVAQLGLRGPVTVLDGGNCFPAYRVLRLLRACTLAPLPAIQRVYIRRAFTCYQMLSLLEGTLALPQPCLVLDPLATFYDEQVTNREARRLLDGCLCQLERLARVAPVLVALASAPTTGRDFLAEQVCACAQQLLTIELPVLQTSQPALF